MAIDKDEYEISNTINSLAQILRYGLDKSNSMVEIRREVEDVYKRQVQMQGCSHLIIKCVPKIWNLVGEGNSGT